MDILNLIQVLSLSKTMIKININEIDRRNYPKIIAIYAIIKGDKVYIGKSIDVISRLMYHKTNTLKGGDMYILEAYKYITNFDLMIMEDFYISKFKALGYKVINVADAIPKRIRNFLMGKTRKIKLYNQFLNEDYSNISNIFDIEVYVNSKGTPYMRMCK